MREQPRQATEWRWHEGLRFVYHPKGCQRCMDYCAHAAQADLMQEESYLKAIRTRDVAIQEESFYRRKADAYLDELDVADRHIKCLEEQIGRYERQLGLGQDYQERSVKRPRYESSKPEARPEHTPSVNTGSHRSTPTSQVPQSVPQTAVAPANIHKDVLMGDSNVKRFPVLPQPSALNQPSMPQTGSWVPAPPRSLLQPLRNTAGRPVRPTPLILRNEEDLVRAMAQAHEQDNHPALARMMAYIRQIHDTPKATRSPIQNEAIVRWKAPAWAQPVNMGGNPNVPMGVNTPRLTDPPEEWARWFWRDPREASNPKGQQWHHPHLGKRSISGHGACTSWRWSSKGMSSILHESCRAPGNARALSKVDWRATPQHCDKSKVDSSGPINKHDGRRHGTPLCTGWNYHPTGFRCP